jgi:5'-3' exonuclease
MSYIIIDTANMFMRARHSTRGDIGDKVGISLHIMMHSVRKAWRDFEGKHVVFAFEGRSWRKDHYSPYKANRALSRSVATPREQEEDQLFWEVFDQFKKFIAEKTNCTVLHHPQLEADDLIAGWIQTHPNDQHVIVSSDGDFAQLISSNVKQFNGVTNVTTTIDGYFDERGKPIIDNKTKKPKGAPDPEWQLFVKCMRGDTSDNVFSAYPGVRTNGTKNKVGLTEAFKDRKSKGYNWNNLMLQRWVDHNGQEHQVINDYLRNVTLCDLTAQPDHIRIIIKETIDQACLVPKKINQVGIRVLKFCASYDLTRISENIESYSEPFAASYQAYEEIANV